MDIGMKPDAINLYNLQNFYFELKLILIKFNKSAKVFFELVIILLSVSFSISAVVVFPIEKILTSSN